MANKQPDGLAPGIYFKLKAFDYHKDTALSHGGIVHILEGGWLQYWTEGPLNLKRKAWKAKPPQVIGQYKHELLLEEAEFHKRYTYTGGPWNTGKISITRGDYDQIVEAIKEIRGVEKAAKMFTHGFPEVSIVFICPVTGIRCRIRLDWLRVFGGIDYKSTASIQNRALGNVINKYGYDIQEAFYCDGLAEIKQALRAGTAKAYDCPDDAWLKRFMDDDRNWFKFLFQRSESPFVFRVMRMPDMMIDTARTLIRDAKTEYAKGIRLYGRGRPPAGTGETEEFNIYHMPRSSEDRGDHLLT